MSARVAILGCGPAGLLCAWAVEQAGLEPVIYSRKEKSSIPGSQHLHGPVEGITSPYPEGTIQFVRIGTAEGYAKKVYGDPKRETGWDNYLQVYPSWNVINAYEQLWDKYEAQIYDMDLGTRINTQMIVDQFGLGKVISTVPAQVLCFRPHSHKFVGTPYYIKKLPTPEADRDHEIVVYNGILSDPWYRWAILGGQCTLESTGPLPGTEVTAGTKAITNDCDCWEGGIHRCGRWAEWTHGITMYKAYLKAQQVATDILRGSYD